MGMYGKVNVSYNVHQLLHLTDSVEARGPLWATSCFPFEGRNILLYWDPVRCRADCMNFHVVAASCFVGREN